MSKAQANVLRVVLCCLPAFLLLTVEQGAVFAEQSKLRYLTAAAPSSSVAAADRPFVPGAELWVARFDEGNSQDEASSVVVSPDGTKVFVTGGSSPQSKPSDYATVAYDASTGITLWSHRYNGPGDGEDKAVALDVSPDGAKVFVTGRSFVGSPSEVDYTTIAYETSTGAMLWLSRYDGPFHRSYDSPFALGVSPDGTKVFVTGAGRRGPEGTPDSDYATVAYDSSTGATFWARRYGALVGGQEWTRGLGVSPDGTKVFVTGHVLGAGGTYDYGTISYEAATGASLWVRTYSGVPGRSDFASSLSVTPDGTKVFVTGTSEGGSRDLDIATIAYETSTGATVWERRFTRLARGTEEAVAIDVSPDGTKVILTGRSDTFGSSNSDDYVTLAYQSATGVQLWVRFYNAGYFDFAFDLQVSPDGNSVYVTGVSHRSEGVPGDYGTIAYSVVSGETSWVSRYDGPGAGHDAAFALDVSPDGSKLYVTGQSVQVSYDYATVAYSTS